MESAAGEAGEAATRPAGAVEDARGVPTGSMEKSAEARKIQVTEEAQRIAELLSISPETINIQVNVGFNTKFAAEEILSLRKDNTDLREQNRRLRARLGDIEPPERGAAGEGAGGGGG